MSKIKEFEWSKILLKFGQSAAKSLILHGKFRNESEIIEKIHEFILEFLSEKKEPIHNEITIETQGITDFQKNIAKTLIDHINSFLHSDKSNLLLNRKELENLEKSYSVINNILQFTIDPDHVIEFSNNLIKIFYKLKEDYIEFYKKNQTLGNNSIKIYLEHSIIPLFKNIKDSFVPKIIEFSEILGTIEEIHKKTDLLMDENYIKFLFQFNQKMWSFSHVNLISVPEFNNFYKILSESYQKNPIIHKELLKGYLIRLKAQKSKQSLIKGIVSPFLIENLIANLGGESFFNLPSEQKAQKLGVNLPNWIISWNLLSDIMDSNNIEEKKWEMVINSRFSDLKDNFESTRIFSDLLLGFFWNIKKVPFDINLHYQVPRKTYSYYHKSKKNNPKYLRYYLDLPEYNYLGKFLIDFIEKARIIRNHAGHYINETTQDKYKQKKVKYFEFDNKTNKKIQHLIDYQEFTSFCQLAQNFHQIFKLLIEYHLVMNNTNIKDYEMFTLPPIR